MNPRRALVFGASGLIGRWLVLRLSEAGAEVVAAARSAESADRLECWLSARGHSGRVEHLLVDFARDGLGLDPTRIAGGALAGITEVHNVAGAYRFGMSADEAREANVEGARRVVEIVSALGAPRLVHLSGYRVAAHPGLAGRWSAETRKREYRRLGAYEASKLEADAEVRARADELAVPLTVVNPASVIGDSRTGESDQLIGLAGTVRDLASGRLPALPGSAATFVPVVTVDYLADFLVVVGADAATLGQDYWVLDDATPTLPDLLRLIGEHLGVRVPRMRVPVRLLRLLPGALTGADPETLSFLSEDRYPTRPALELARRHGLAMPDVRVAVLRWVDHLVATPGFLTSAA